MRIARVSLFLLLVLMTMLPAGAQPFEQMTLLRPANAPMSVRAAAMGAVSDDDMSVNPAALADVTALRVSLGAARTSYELTQIESIGPSTSGLVSHSLSRNALSHVLLAMPLGGFVVGGYYRANPSLSGP